MMDVVVTTRALTRAKPQSKCHHQQTNTQLLYRPDALPVVQPTVSKHWREKVSHSTDLLTPSSPGVFNLVSDYQRLLFTFGGGLPSVSSAV